MMMMKYFQYDRSRNQPIRKLIKDFLSGRLLNNLADSPLADDFFADMAEKHYLTPIEKQKLHQQAQLFLTKFLNAENDETQLNALKQLVLDIFALKQQNKNEALKYQELHVPPLADFNPNDDRGARHSGYKIGQEARKFLAQQHAKGNVSTMVEAIYHAKNIMRRSS